jgi:hypothetical protein
VVRRPAGARPRAARLHRRDMGLHRHGADPRSGAARRAPARRRPTRPCVDAPSGARRTCEQDAARDRVLPCVRPLMRHDHGRGPVWDSGVRSTSLERARSATRAPGSPDPASPTLRHTCPSTSSPPDSLATVTRSSGHGTRTPSPSSGWARLPMRSGSARSVRAVSIGAS